MAGYLDAFLLAEEVLRLVGGESYLRAVQVMKSVYRERVLQLTPVVLVEVAAGSECVEASAMLLAVLASAQSVQLLALLQRYCLFSLLASAEMDCILGYPPFGVERFGYLVECR